MAILFCTQLVFAAQVPAICGTGEYLRKIAVSTEQQLHSALGAARAGDYISVRKGTYVGNFLIENIVAKSSLRVHLCGESDVVIKAAKANSGYGLHIKNSRFIRVSNIEVTGHLKGVMLDGSSGNILQNLNVHHIGTEGVHFRSHSSSNTLLSSEISYTGLFDDWFGEGVYIGSSKNNWCTYTFCKPDQSDRNKVLGNYIHHTSAESIDIKEGTQGGQIEGNSFQGALMTGEYADSFIDVKGSGYVISKNAGSVGYVNSKAAQINGFQVHVISGTTGANNNVISANEVIGNLSGYIVDIQSKAIGTVVTCDNKATRSLGLTNKPPCQPPL